VSFCSNGWRITDANINLLLILAGFATLIDICQVKYLNNIIEQDHRFIKKITKPMMGFKGSIHPPYLIFRTLKSKDPFLGWQAVSL
jgi:hypothetical protein